MLQSIGVIEDNTFLSAMQHAGSVHRHSEGKMGDNLLSRCRTKVLSCVTPREQQSDLDLTHCPERLRAHPPGRAQALHRASYSRQTSPYREEQCL